MKMKAMKTIKALLLMLVLTVCPCLCLFAEIPEGESEACAPVNTRLCEYSLPLPLSTTTPVDDQVVGNATIRQTSSADTDADVNADFHPEQKQAQEQQEQEEDCFAESKAISTEVLTQEEAIAKLFYPGCYNHYQHYFFGPTQYQSTFLESGSYLTLENGSIWKMAEADIWRISGWAVSDRLQLSRNPHLYSPYPYRLRNLENGETIRVVVRVGPRYDSPLFCACMELDAYTGDVWCSNGTAWWVPIRDRAILDTWRPHDVVMIGVNEDFMHRECPHLLINLTNGSCCRAAWLP